MMGPALTLQEETEEDEAKKEGLKIMDLHGGPIRSILDPSSPVDPPSHPTTLMISSPDQDREKRRRKKMRAIKSLSLVQSDV